MRRKSKKKMNRVERIDQAVERFAESATRWLGSPMSLIVHTSLFIGAFGLVLFGIPLDSILLLVTTLVSFEAIYLSIFIQMSVNRQASILVEVQDDVEDIQEDIEEIQEDIEEIQEDVEEIQEESDEDEGEILPKNTEPS